MNTGGEKMTNEKQTVEQPEVEVEIVDAEPVEDPITEQTDIINVADQSLSNLASQEAIDNAVSNAIARAEASKRLKAALLSMTNRFDWYSMRAEGEPDGKPYLAETGATKVMHAFGIQVVTDEGQHVPNTEGGFEYVYTGRVRALAFSDAWFPVVGSRWSEDGFFTKGGKNRADPGDVRKAAMTNLYNRAIKLATGIKSITWEELEAIPQFKDIRKNCVKIGFTGGAGGASAPAGTIADLQKKPHIQVSVPYQNTNARTIVKNMPRDQRTFTGKEGTPQNVWIVAYTKQNFGRIADLAAEHGDVKFKPVNVPESDLP
jgi:hypothetical protein